MLYSVTLYKNTGLGLGNCLDNSGLLNLFDSIVIPEIALKQPRGINNIRISTTWNQISEVDYCKIGDDCYWISNIAMLNDNVAVLNIVYDAITSIGINNFTIVDGWCTRRTLGESEDELFDNVMTEPFSPINPLKVVGFKSFPEVPTTGKTYVVLSTVDLSQELSEWQKAKFYNAQWEGEGIVGCAVPELPALTGSNTEYNLLDTENIGIGALDLSSQVPASSLFDMSNNSVKSNIAYVYAISADNTILDAYELPSDYFQVNADSSGKVVSVTQKIRKYTSQAGVYINNNLSNYANKKVFSGQFLKSMVLSPSSGNSECFDIETIAPANKDPSLIQYYILPDGRYNGFPVLVPLNYQGLSNIAGLALGSVAGSVWQRAPFSTDKTGVASQMIQYNTGRYLRDAKMGMDIGFGAFKAATSYAGSQMTGAEQYQFNQMSYSDQAIVQKNNTYSGISNVTGQSQGILGSLMNMGLYQEQANATRNYLSAQQSASEIHFMNVPTNVSYFGNLFFERLLGLTAQDMERFDLFLTAFGYTVSEQLSPLHLTKNTTFDYIVADNVSIKGSFTNDIRAAIISAFTNGVRIWHKKPARITRFMNRNQEVNNNVDQ